MARPTKLTEELVERAEKYIGEMARFELPSHVGLAIYLDVAESSLYLWRDVDSDLGRQFSETLANIKTFQHYQALNKGLNGEWNSTIVKLVLANHGYVEKRETDLTTKGKELSSPVLGGLTQHEGGDVPSDHRDS
ncbi:DNA-packaging protein [Rathayibacter caricis]|uniref:DNA-packaging protein n=1 Tax=Rathayibacter caricis TaxID=110936 RepID=UPI001FB22248|nr:DNA-packaging protein [Rathayibacter caricis]MCJ1694645.1 DNA-packaging protein [Rathayibacter caricis]